MATRVVLIALTDVKRFLSMTVQVDQDVDVPWPLEVYGHDGKATNVTMEPGMSPAGCCMLLTKYNISSELLADNKTR